MEKEPKYIVVIGASAGGLHSIIEIAAQLNEEVNAAIFVVLHTSNITYNNVVISRLQMNSVFTCKMAEHEEPILSKHLYVAVPDKHLLIKRGKILLGDGPAESRWRPSIDVMFRSAAVAYSTQVIGIVLTGMLDDGTSGMQIIKQCGGTTIVQDPAEAEYPDMPVSVLQNVEVDYCTTLQRIGQIIIEKSKNGITEKGTVPPEIMKEAEIAERVAMTIDDVASVAGEKSLFSCPDCGGGLWEIKQGNVTRYRCHTGHMYTQKDLLSRQEEELEQTFYISLRMMEERRNLLLKMAAEEESKGWVRSAAYKTQRARELQVHIERLKDILFAEKNNRAHSSQN